VGVSERGVGVALHRLADELTATLAGLLGYVAVLALLGMGVIQILRMDEVGVAIESVPRTAWVVERPTVIEEAAVQTLDGSESPNRPMLRTSVAAR
jgi:hypothetical protein